MYLNLSPLNDVRSLLLSEFLHKPKFLGTIDCPGTPYPHTF